MDAIHYTVSYKLKIKNKATYVILGVIDNLEKLPKQNPLSHQINHY